MNLLALRLLVPACFVLAWGSGTPIKGKVAFITGASSGLGAVVAKELAGKGMKVVLTARRVDKLKKNVEDIQKAGGEAVAYACDVSNAKSIKDAFASAEEKYGGIDFVFANAGTEGGVLKTGLNETEDDDLNMIFDINVVGAVTTLKYAVLAMEKRGGGTVAFTSSIGAFCGEMCGNLAGSSFIPYAASKAAVDMAAEAAHGAYHSKGINVYNLNLAQYQSEIAERLGYAEKGPYGFNPIFKETLGNPVHIAETLIAILDGTSKWPAGSAFVSDNDATIDAKHFFRARKEPGELQYMGWPSPEELKKFAMDVKGEPYDFSKKKVEL